MIIRADKTRNYTVMSNIHLFDSRLSLKAKGFMSQVLALKDEWEFSIEGLATLMNEGKTTIKSCLKELEATGYLTRTREHDEKGRYEWIYLLSEKPSMENPSMDNPSMDNRTLLNTNISNTNISNTEYGNGNSPQRFKKPTMEELEEYFLQKGSTKAEAEKFFNYYESNGWKVGKNKMQKWRNCASGWISRDFGGSKKKMPDYNYSAPKKEEKQFDEDEWRKFAEEVGLDVD